MIRTLPVLYAISAICFLSCTASKKNVLLVTSHPNDAQKTYHTLLITGQGDVAARYDIENMAIAIKSRLRKVNVHCNYAFLGDPRKVDINANLKKVTTAHPYDALLRITPQDARLKKLYRLPTGPYYTGTPGGNSTVHFDDGVIHRLVLEFGLVLTEAEGQVIWAGTLLTNTQGPPPHVIHTTIGKRLAAVFKDNQLLPPPLTAGN